MSLAPGQKLGPYEVISPLGAGGMGEVYRARDTRLDRIVALKILPKEFSCDPLRKQRFEQEAKTISSLNHPHICVLHDVGHQDGIDFLVMECVEGETLAKRLEKGPLPLEQVLKFGAQIADALDKAHRSGVVHRDLKPGNIMLTPTGAKLLDFGLAKPAVALVSGSTLTVAARPSPMTQEGTIVGTFQYMSPEQVEGKEVDARSDIFSVGTVLYEMLTGRKAFQGKSQLSVASAILEKEPEAISAIKPLTPPALDHVIRRCLAKDPEERWQTARDLALELQWTADSDSPIGGPASATAITKNRYILAWAVAGICTLAAIVFGFRPWVRPADQARVIRSYIKGMPDSSLLLTGQVSGFALSPDAKQMAYVAQNSAGKVSLWLRVMDSLQAQPLAGTENATFPFWSPDSRSIGFFASGKLKRIDTSGGPPLTLCDAPNGRGGTWNRDGVILFSPNVNSSIARVSALGGTPTTITTLDASKGETTHRWPRFLPDGKHYFFVAGSVFGFKENPSNVLLLGTLDGTTSKVLMHVHGSAEYASGHILFMRQNTLMAQALDINRLELTGEAVPVADPVQQDELTLQSVFSASQDGLLTYEEGSSGTRQLTLVDRTGKPVTAPAPPDSYGVPRFSPDGKSVAFMMTSPGFDIFTYDFARGLKTRLTFSSAGVANLYPVWSPNGKRIAFTSIRGGQYGFYQKAADGSGTEEPLLEGSAHAKYVNDWSPDAKSLVFQDYQQGASGIYVLPLDTERKPRAFQQSGLYTALRAAFSPDSKWLAYGSNESGEFRVYVVPFPGPGGKWQISPGDGDYPRWRRDGKELFYLTMSNKLMAAEVQASGTSFAIGAVKPLFEARAYRSIVGAYDVSPDGQRFALAYEPGQPNAAIALVENWDAELKKK